MGTRIMVILMQGEPFILTAEAVAPDSPAMQWGYDREKTINNGRKTSSLGLP